MRPDGRACSSPRLSFAEPTGPPCHIDSLKRDLGINVILTVADRTVPSTRPHRPIARHYRPARTKPAQQYYRPTRQYYEWQEH
jgi:hypothetical protein